ncbi:hypothetical protein J4441_03060 [Candidatus Micrarchaeota archaeon]|nr:hypothetical protein [Candidatus Micrarchaeota archaeon]
MQHVSMLAWRPQMLLPALQQAKEAFPDAHLFACCQEKDAHLPSQGGLQFFCAEDADEFFKYGAEYGTKELQSSIGHWRNLMQLASVSLGSPPLIFLDDDILPDKNCGAVFSASLQKYDLVQGAYNGCLGNGIYMLVYFFDWLLDQRKRADFQNTAELMLRGTVRRTHAQASLRGLSGGLFGISSKLKSRQAFFPTKYPFDDHFFEFCCRHAFKQANFMDERTPASDIPTATHETVTSASFSKLVDHYILYVRSSIVETYSYYCLCGKIPQLVNNRHVLARISNFDAQQMCSLLTSQAALEKFKKAAEHHLKGGFGKPIDSQLRRVASLCEQDFFVGIEELEKEWANFIQEQQWLKDALMLANANPQHAKGALFASRE